MINVTNAFNAAQLAKDKQVRALEMAALASNFVAPTSASAKKAGSLQRIRQRHDNAADSRQKDRVLSTGLIR